MENQDESLAALPAILFFVSIVNNFWKFSASHVVVTYGSPERSIYRWHSRRPWGGLLLLQRSSKGWITRYLQGLPVFPFPEHRFHRSHGRPQAARMQHTWWNTLQLLVSTKNIHCPAIFPLQTKTSQCVIYSRSARKKLQCVLSRSTRKKSHSLRLPKLYTYSQRMQ